MGTTSKVASIYTLTMKNKIRIAFSGPYKIALIVAIILVITSCAPVPRLPPPARVDISNFDALPDALIVTKNISQLPKDVLSHPWLKEVLTEEFINYYEYNERSLGIRGVLRRISYEHNTTLLDGVLAYIFNTPAEIAFWKGYDGKLKTYLMIIHSSGLTKYIGIASKIASYDSQLGFWGNKNLENGTSVPVYKLNYSGNRAVYIAPAENYTYIFSDPGLHLPVKEGQEEISENQKATSDTHEDIGIFSKLFGIEKNTVQHSIVVTLRYLSFGYQQFFPSLKALNFDYRENGWKMSILTTKADDNTQIDSTPLWKAVPHRPALSVAIPVDPMTVQNILNSMLENAEADTSNLLRSVQSPIVISWYSDFKLYTPLVIIRTKDLTEHTETLRMLFQKSIGDIEVSGETGEESFVWTSQVSSKYGIYRDVSNSKKAFFKVCLAYQQEYLIFSPDHRLVENTLTVLNKTYPALSDSLPVDQANKSLIIYPESVAQLIKESISDSLPISQEAIFRESVSKYLFPRLDGFSQFPAASLSMPVFYDIEQAVWEDVQWEMFNHETHEK